MKTKHRLPLHLLLLLTVSSAFKALAQPAAPRALPPTTEKQLRLLLAEPVVSAAHVGLSIVALGSTDNPQAFPAKPYAERETPVLFEVDADKRFLSASNTKLYTAGIALHALGADRKFVTRVDAFGPVTDGTERGGLVLVGGGDPSLSYDDLVELARAVAATGIKRVGEIGINDALFTAETFGGRYPDGWTLDDAIWYYGPQISALTVNRNQVDVTIEGAAEPGQQAKMSIDTPTPGGMIHSLVMTGPPELKDKAASELISFSRAGGGHPVVGSLVIWGQVAPGQKITEGVAVPDPQQWVSFLFRRALQESGIEIVSKEEMDTWKPPPSSYFVTHSLRTIATHESPPLKILTRRLLKNSDNLYAEVFLRNVGITQTIRRDDNTEIRRSIAARAHRALFDWLRTNEVPAEGLRFTDGSGLSRYNLITPRATARLLATVDRMPGGDAFWEAMPIAGVDGTLRNRMKNSAAANNVRAKTGTFSIVSTLSGYVTTRDGHRLAVSLLTNFAPDGTAVRDWQNRLYTVLAEADWRTPSPN